MIKIELDESTLIDALDKSGARKLIMEIDAAQQCCDFTVRTIKELIDILECDMTREEIAKELGFRENTYNIIQSDNNFHPYTGE